MKERHDPHFHMPEFRALLQDILRVETSALSDMFESSNETWNQDRSRFGDEFPYIEISAVGLGTGEYAVQNIALSEAPSRAKMVVRNGDFIISTTRPHRGAVAIILPEHNGIIASTGFAVLRKKNPQLDSRFLFYALTSSLVLRQFLQRSSGGNYPAIVPEEMAKVLVPIPKPAVQLEITEEMERARASRRRKLEQADALLAGLDAFLLDRLGLTPRKKVYPLYFAARLGEAWNRCDPDFHSPKFKELRESIERCGHSVVPVGEICLSIKSGFAAGREMQAFDDFQGVPHIRPLNISAHGELSFEGTKYVPKESVPESEIIQQGEVLLNNTNSTEWVGKSTVFDAKRVCCCSNHITRLTLKPEVTLPWYLACFFNAIRSTGYLGLTATNFVNQAGINTGTISALRVPVPGKKIQLEIVDELRKRRLEARRLREEASREWEAAKARFEARLLDRGA